MSASIMYRPLKSGYDLKKDITIDDFTYKMERAFHLGPNWVLTKDEQEKLNLLFIGSRQAIWKEISDAIDKFGTIEVYLQY